MNFLRKRRIHLLSHGASRFHRTGHARTSVFTMVRSRCSTSRYSCELAAHGVVSFPDPRTEGDYASHYRTAEIDRCVRRCGCVATRGARPESAIPVVGYLNFGSTESHTSRLTGLRRG